ncbi:MAG: T9SS type A sorting domain-containing protein, partial [Bacteroidia bacterium]|nr:T9SS type A sorting domain-containing protein [Bacteroidia bacterium]
STPIRYELCSLTGMLLAKGEFVSQEAEHREPLPVTGLPAGVYILRTEVRGSPQVWKLVKE